jgi:hypothetical protein
VKIDILKPINELRFPSDGARAGSRPLEVTFCCTIGGRRAFRPTPPRRLRTCAIRDSQYIPGIH